MLAGALLVFATAGSAIAVKEFGAVPPLAAVADAIRPVANMEPTSEPVDQREMATEAELARLAMAAQEPEAAMAKVVSVADVSGPEDAPSAQGVEESFHPDTRWFNGRPVRPAKTLRMLVTGYSPDERSCPGTADGLTATLHDVRTNGYRLVAADTRLLPFGSMLTIPGYDSSQIVPVLDRGGAIKGHRLDLLFATHAEAIKWGKRWINVTVWEFADGQPMVNPRTLR